MLICFCKHSHLAEKLVGFAHLNENQTVIWARLLFFFFLNRRSKIRQLSYNYVQAFNILCASLINIVTLKWLCYIFSVWLL